MERGRQQGGSCVKERRQLLVEQTADLLVFQYLSGARTRAGALSPVDVPRRSRGPGEPVYSVIGGNATSTGTQTQYRTLPAMERKFSAYHWVKPPCASLHLLMEKDKWFTKQRAEQLHPHPLIDKDGQLLSNKYISEI